MVSFFKKKPVVNPNLMKKAWEETITHPVALASAGLGAASLHVALGNKKENEKIRKESAVNSKRQLQAMNNLTNALTGVERTMKSQNYRPNQQISRIPRETTKKRKKFLGLFSDSGKVRFNEKKYSEDIDNIVQMAMKGGGLGLTVGTIGSGISGGIALAKGDGDTRFLKALKFIGTTTLIGASLGVLIALVQNYDRSVSQASVNTGNLMDQIQRRLKQMGFEGNKDYTKDPKFANMLKTKVCIVISKQSDDLKLLINTVQDPKLKQATDEIIKGLPKTAVTSEKASTKFNDLTISTLSKGSKDPDFIARIIEMFIKRGFPVYLVEVG